MYDSFRYPTNRSKKDDASTFSATIAPIDRAVVRGVEMMAQDRGTSEERGFALCEKWYGV